MADRGQGHGNQVEQTRRSLEVPPAHVQIVRGGRERSMAEQTLQCDQIDARFQQVRGEGVAQRLSTMLIHRRCESATVIIRSSTKKVTSCGAFAAKPKTASLSS
jgi:hypothetical protein